MSSILTNNGAMVALQTMKGISRSMNMTQAEISTGKTVSTAKDNAAIWAISKVMESDVKGFKGISDSLAVGSSTISVARQASETVTDLLTEVKGKIVAAQASNVDRTKIQTDIVALRDQIASVVGAAQFNGLNLVNGTQTSVDVLSSLDRSATNVSASSITVNAQNLSTGAYVAKALLTGTTGASASGDTAGFSLDAATGTGTIALVEPGATAATSFVAGDKVSITFGKQTASYTVSTADAAAATTADIVAVGLKSAVEALGISGLTVNYDSATPGSLALSNAGTKALSASMQVTNAGAGGLATLAAVDVSTGAGATAALGNIESLVQTSINAAASFGSVQKRIEIQSDFVGKLTDALKSGIGAMVDADMEEASARLQALQVQQQLSTQALSIANQQPQNVLALFR
jgi:flagellin